MIFQNKNIYFGSSREIVSNTWKHARAQQMDVFLHQEGKPTKLQDEWCYLGLGTAGKIGAIELWFENIKSISSKPLIIQFDSSWFYPITNVGELIYVWYWCGIIQFCGCNFTYYHYKQWSGLPEKCLSVLMFSENLPNSWISNSLCQVLMELDLSTYHDDKVLDVCDQAFLTKIICVLDIRLYMVILKI